MIDAARQSAARPLLLQLLLSLAPAVIGRAQAQAFPNRFVRLIVPLAPGGPTDVAARVMADPLSRMWSQQVVVENRPGGGTNIAARDGGQIRARRAHDPVRHLLARGRAESLSHARL